MGPVESTIGEDRQASDDEHKVAPVVAPLLSAASTSVLATAPAEKAQEPSITAMEEVAIVDDEDELPAAAARNPEGETAAAGETAGAGAADGTAAGLPGCSTAW